MNDINTVIEAAKKNGIKIEQFTFNNIVHTEFKSLLRWEFEGFTLSSDKISDEKINIALEEINNLAEAKKSNKKEINKKLDRKKTNEAVNEISSFAYNFYE